jgi:hypothetical protein
VAEHGFVEGDHMQSSVNKRKQLVVHFFSKEVSEEEFRAIERRHLESEEFGIEVGSSDFFFIYELVD